MSNARSSSGADMLEYRSILYSCFVVLQNYINYSYHEVPAVLGGMFTCMSFTLAS